MERWLVLGGTAWLGREMARAAHEAGHEVTCLARGESGEVPAGVRWVRADRDDRDAYAALDGSWDAVVDVTSQPGHARSAVRELGPRSAHWVLVSSANVYADLSGPIHERDLLRGPLVGDTAPPELYGEGKVACERVVTSLPGHLVLRAGLLVGPGDPSDRFGYWVARLAAARHDDVLVPEVPGAAVQALDVRDLAAFVLDAVSRGLVGTMNVAGEPVPLAAVLRLAAQAADHGGRIVPADAETLVGLGVQPWAGERSLPLWLPADVAGLASMDTAAAEAAGLERRSLEQTLDDVLADERARGLDRSRRAGLTRADEVDVLGRL